jgi:hypothetical protein
MNDDDFSRWPGTSRTDVNMAQVEETVLESLCVTIQGY